MATSGIIKESETSGLSVEQMRTMMGDRKTEEGGEIGGSRPVKGQWDKSSGLLGRLNGDGNLASSLLYRG